MPNEQLGAWLERGREIAVEVMRGVVLERERRSPEPQHLGRDAGWSEPHEA